jgi:hypothetical protein
MAATFNFRVPDEQEAGAYSNVMTVWHTPFEFTFDFAVMLPSAQDSQGNIVVPARVVARVKVPPTAMADIIDAMTKNLQLYEAQFGPTARPIPGQLRIEIPDDISSLFPEDDENGEQA